MHHRDLSIGLRETDGVVVADRMGLISPRRIFHVIRIHSTSRYCFQGSVDRPGSMMLGRRTKVTDYASPRPCCIDVMTLRRAGEGGRREESTEVQRSACGLRPVRGRFSSGKLRQHVDQDYRMCHPRRAPERHCQALSRLVLNDTRLSMIDDTSQTWQTTRVRSHFREENRSPAVLFYSRSGNYANETRLYNVFCRTNTFPISTQNYNCI